MRRFVALLNREVVSYFYSPIAYVVGCFMLLLMGLSFYSGISFLRTQPSEVSVIEAFFNTVPFWIGFLLMFPLLTMRVFSEEFKMGTVESLMTAPVGDWQVVLSKYVGVLFFYIVLWIPTLLFFIAFQLIAQQPAATSIGAYFGGYSAVFLIGMFYLSIGCLASVTTKNQIIAAVVSFVMIMALFLFGLMTTLNLDPNSSWKEIAGYFSTIEHMMQYSRGFIETRTIVFYVSSTIFMLTLTYHIFQTRRWRY